MIVKLELPIKLTEEDGRFVAICPVFNVGSQGENEESALKNAKEALELYLDDRDVQREYQDIIFSYAVSVVLSDKEFKSGNKDPHHSDFGEANLLDVVIHGNPEAADPLGA